MGQKINPISLRLQYTNRQFDNCWYSNYFYKNLINKDVLFHSYLNNFLKLMKLPTGRYSIQHLQKKTQIYNFFCYSKSTRQWRSQLFGLAPNTKFLKKTRYFFKNKTQFKRKTRRYTKFHSFYNAVNQLAVYKLQKKITSFQNFRLWAAVKNTACSPFFSLSTKANRTIPEKLLDLSAYFSPKCRVFEKNLFFSKHPALLENGDQASLKNEKIQPKQRGSGEISLNHEKKKVDCFLKINENSSRLFLQNLFVYKTLKSSLKQKKHSSKSSLNRSISTNQKQGIFDFKYKNYLESSLSSVDNVELNFIPVRVKNDWQHANYLADEIVYFLEKRIPFRRLKNKILKQLAKVSTIRGVRITCSGRVGGKSKKAQRAKTECIKYGQTSLQVFSSKIDFSMKTAFTSFGSVGVKVWICYY